MRVTVIFADDIFNSLHYLRIWLVKLMKINVPEVIVFGASDVDT